MDRGDPRTWYYALMDYGAMLGRTGENANKRSAAYTRQAPFEGSRRQIRGAVLRTLLERGSMPLAELCALLGLDAANVESVVDALAKEGFLDLYDGGLSLRT